MDNSFGSSSAVDWKICHGYNEPPLIAALEQSALYHPGTHHVVTQPGGLQTEPFDFTGPANGWSTTVTRPGEHTVNTPPYQHTGQSKEFFWRPTKSATSSLGSEPDEDVKAAQSTPVAPPTDLGSQINMASASQGSGSSSNDSDSSPSQSVKRGKRSLNRKNSKGKGKTNRSRLGCFTCREKKKGCDRNFLKRTDPCGNTATKCTAPSSPAEVRW